LFFFEVFFPKLERTDRGFFRGGRVIGSTAGAKSPTGANGRHGYRKDGVWGQPRLFRLNRRCYLSGHVHSAHLQGLQLQEDAAAVAPAAPSVVTKISIEVMSFFMGITPFRSLNRNSRK
jgi:hypothetical protein